VTTTTREVTHSTPTRTAATDPSRFWWAIGLITVAQLALRGWAASGGWFYWDDFWWHDIVARNGLFETAGMSLGGHYSPLTYIPYYLITAAFPYEWAPRVVIMLVTLLGINAGVLAVTRRLWPTRGPQLAVYVLWAFSSLAAPSWLWYSQFSMMGALLLTSTWTLWAYLRALSTRGNRSSWLAVALLALSLFTQERMLVTATLMGLFLVLVCSPTMVAARWRERRGLWAASLAVMSLWVLVYLSLPKAESLPTPVHTVVRLTIDMVRVSALPSLLGGPWVLDNEPVLSRAATPVVMQIVALGVLTTLVLFSLRLHSRAWAAWSILGLGLLIDAALVAVVRGSTMQDLAIGEWRYFSDLAVLAPLLMVSAFVAPGVAPNWSIGRLRAAWGAMSLFTASAVMLGILLGGGWHKSLARPFVQTALSDLRDAQTPVVIMESVLPDTVVNEALGAQRFASRVFSIVDPPALFDEPTTDPKWLNREGELVPAALAITRMSPSSGLCTFSLRGSETVWVPLPVPAEANEWGIRVRYRASQDVTVGVTDGVRTVTAAAPAGKESLFVPFYGLGHQVGLFLSSPSAAVCVQDVGAGRPGPDEG